MSCPVCNTWNTTGQACVQVRCLACNAEQCHSRGLGRGTCSICYRGMLPGWSGNNNPDQPGRYSSSVRTDVRCQYKGCDEMAVYTSLPGPKDKACKFHGDAIVARRHNRRVR